MDGTSRGLARRAGEHFLACRDGKMLIRQEGII